MNSWWHSRRAWLAPWLMWLAWPVLAQGGGAAVAPFDIRWEVERTVRLPQDRGVRTEARFVVEATASQLLGAGGWALYFTCLAEADEGPALGPFVLERVNGTLYRLRPTAGFRGMTAGQPLHLRFRHPGPMPLPDRAPQGPYLVFDSDPDRGLAPQRYRVVVPARGEQLDVATGARLPGPAAEELFARHAAVADLPASALPPVFPTPRALQRSGGTLAWRAMPRIDAAAALAGEATLAREMLQPFFAPGSVARGPSARLRLSVGAVAGQSSPEAYELRVDRGHGVAIRGASAAGVARGLQSLRSLLPLSHQPAAGVALPALVVRDAPRFEHRGLLLDVARHFHPKETVLRVIDLMARFKLNKLHLHLTDDEGWRLAIPGLPELTEFGARRGHSADPWRHLPPAHGSGPDASRSSGSGFYDAEEYKHILSYAAARHVEVIPEIEMPGHARAAVKAMQLRAQRRSAAGAPDAQRFLLADPGDRSRYRSPQLHDDHLMDPGLESTYAFVEHVVGALATLHREAGVPLRQLHVGADELPAGAWSGSPAAQAAIARDTLAGLPGLWNRFYERVAAILERHGVAAGGWEELGARRAGADGGGRLVPNEHFVGRGFTLYVWNNLDDADDLAYRLANAGYRTVLAPATRLYFDMAASHQPGEAGVDWAALVDLRDVFDYLPLEALRSSPLVPGVPAGKTGLDAVGRRHIAGIEATLFAETLSTRSRLEHQLLPRLFALAERAWADDPPWARAADARAAQHLHAVDWSRFVQQIGRHLLPSLLRDLPDLDYRIPPPGLRREGDGARANAAWPGLVVRYTLDGTEPDASSAPAGERLPAGGLLKAAAFDVRGRRGLATTLDLR